MLQGFGGRLLGSASVVAILAVAAPSLAQAQVARTSTVVDELIVTAQKREERLLDVPVPISAVQADTLQAVEQADLRDYFTQTPNVTIQLGNSGAPTIAIRGITTGVFSTPTVATLIDDIPYGGNSLFAAGFATPEVDPSDLERIEILRGPQGTLYGASTLGGLLKFVTVDPSTERFSGRVQASATQVEHGDMGYALRGSVNVPVNDSLALRLSAYTRKDGGWVDNLQTGASNINDVEASGVRLAGLWRPSDETSLKLAAIYQKRRVGGSSYVEPTLGGYAQRTMPGTGWIDQELQSYSAVFQTTAGRAQITSLTGYSENTFEDLYDYSRVFLGVARTAFPTAGGVTLEEHVTTRKFSQELRVDLPFGERVNVLLGGFFTNENSTVPQIITATDAQAQPIGVFSSNNPVSAFTEYAVFANGTIDLTDRLELQLGARYAMIDQQMTVSFGGLSPRLAPPVTTEDRPFTFLVTPKYQLSDNVMVYARFASGYRPGGPNTPAAQTGPLPPFSPDKTMNYELGLKGEFLDGMLTLDASLFHIKWEDVLVQVIMASSAAYINGDEARSQGFELSSTLRPFDGLTLSGWVAFSDAELTKPFPPGSLLVGAAGERLPMSPRWSGRFDVDYEFPISGELEGFVGGSVSYVGDRMGPFTRPNIVRQPLPEYTQVDLLAGARWNDLTLTAFVNNLTDEKGVLRGGRGVTFDFAFYYTQPRTIGLSLAKEF